MAFHFRTYIPQLFLAYMVNGGYASQSAFCFLEDTLSQANELCVVVQNNIILVTFTLLSYDSSPVTCA